MKRQSPLFPWSKMGMPLPNSKIMELEAMRSASASPRERKISAPR
jgi:hypothetical protein